MSSNKAHMILGDDFGHPCKSIKNFTYKKNFVGTLWMVNEILALVSNLFILFYHKELMTCNFVSISISCLKKTPDQWFKLANWWVKPMVWVHLRLTGPNIFQSKAHVWEAFYLGFSLSIKLASTVEIFLHLKLMLTNSETFFYNIS